MSNTSKRHLSIKDLEELLKSRGFKPKWTGSHMHIAAPNGSVVIPNYKELSPFMVARIREMLNKCEILSYQEFDSFIAKQSPLLERVIKYDAREKPSAFIYSEVKDALLKQRLVRLGTAPLDTLIREAGVVLEDRLRSVASETDTQMYGVALVDAILSPGKAKIVFSTHPGEQDGARMLYRGAIQFIRNPAMHKLIDYPESEARLFINVVDSLLQLLSEAKLMTSSNTTGT